MMDGAGARAGRERERGGGPLFAGVAAAGGEDGHAGAHGSLEGRLGSQAVEGGGDVMGDR
jgi:hypothetical protein